MIYRLNKLYKIEWYYFYIMNSITTIMPVSKIISFPKLHIDVEYVIGKNAQENFEIIDDAEDHHIWFHVHGHSSSHVIAKLDDELNKKDLRYIIKQGAILCKQYSKLKSNKNVEIVYTTIENITKTEIPGSVITENEKKITI
jgi:predicted ribosome quality control (RQC) complex YloA/Tae2 family protein|tara:strand:+ start:1598 stop:2023 length:426 start_codon:yes stop_codon:yes gene_type:complete